MFICHDDKELIFELKKSGDRCFCGCSATITCHEQSNIDDGYCERCAEKRRVFVERVVGEILIGKKNSFEVSILNSIESMRQNILNERIFFVVDKYFCKHQKEKFKEPYNDIYFLRTVYREKYFAMKIILNSIILDEKRHFSLFNVVDKTNKIYFNYVTELRKMVQNDSDFLKSIVNGISTFGIEFNNNNIYGPLTKEDDDIIKQLKKFEVSSIKNNKLKM